MKDLELFVEPPRVEWSALTARAKVSAAPAVTERVAGILARVRRDGDEAIRQLAAEIDHVSLGSLRVSDDEIASAAKVVPSDVKDAIETAIANIAAFHRAQMPSEIVVETSPGVTCVQRPVPIESVGLYIPGGTAPLFSTVLMLAVPAKIAGCHRIVMCTPTGPDGRVAPVVLYAAHRAGVREIFKIGGAQAIAAMAYGTETVPAVNKIFGPGNRYVTTAKQLVSTDSVAIDMPAGPSEVMVLADATADPEFVASDVLSQCEHGRDSQAIVVTDSVERARQIIGEALRQAALLPRIELVRDSLENSRVIVLADRSDMLDFANLYAPEHLILSVADPDEAVTHITAAGSVFLGNFAPESVGDYASGTNHTLPTSGWATAVSGVNIESYLRRMTIQSLSPDGLRGLAPTVVSMARAEGLDAHARAVIVRLKDQTL
ncbi:MAG: histidinol dehydrogenase [Muribaculaceae bacterium]|nr:histidinol dehydrogenase [Muribaculaceae bacterium]